MKKFNDFDLDVKKVSEDFGGPQNGITKIVTKITKEASNIVLTSVLQGCTPDCLTSECTDGCVHEEFSAECASI